LEVKVAYIYPASEASAEQYEAILGRATDGGKPAGLMVHVAGRDKSGRLQVLEVWESEAAHERFGEQTLFPLFREFGIDVTQGPAAGRIEVTNLIR
jgi:hypothetical protein